MAILGRNGSCGLGQRNADPASLQSSREETRGMNVSLGLHLLSHLGSCLPLATPNSKREGRNPGEAATQISLRTQGKAGGGGWRASLEVNEDVLHSGTMFILLTLTL